MKKKNSEPHTQPLASYWMAPSEEAGAPITCIASTYTFHAALFEDELLPRFLKLKFDDTEKERLFIAEREDKLATVTAAVLVDITQVDGRQTTGRWSQVPVRVPGGCQHSKISLLVWEHHIRALIASANLTTTGYRRNRETAAALDFYDGEGSASRALFRDIIGFLERDVLTWSSMPTGTRDRLRDAFGDARKRAQSWKLPDTRPSLPTVTFVPVAPKRDGAAARGVIDPVMEAWGSYSADHLYVMTPFIGDTEAAVQTTIQELQRVRRARGSQSHLILGGRPSEADDALLTVEQPKWFRDVWVKSWKADGPSLYVVPPKRDSEKVDRALHAKALLLDSPERMLLLVGSSNFSPHGFGIGTHNLEGNLCYVVREKDQRNALWGALPVSWANDGVEDAIWPDDVPVPPDELASTLPPLPRAFEWATFDDRDGTLTLSVAQGHLPATWSVWIPGHDKPVFESSAELSFVDGILTLSLGAIAKAHRLTYITIQWSDGDATYAARLPTLVDQEAELLPPSVLRNLRSEDIVMCLLSGKDPREWAERDEEEDAAIANPSSDASYDPHKAIDTDAFVLYRTRKLGRALAMLSQRIVTTLATPAAMRHRLLHDPVGPRMLAHAITEESSTGTDIVRAASAFALAELMLVLSYAAIRVDPKRSLKLRPIFEEALAEIEALGKTFTDDLSRHASLALYVNAARSRCAELAGDAHAS